MKTILIATCVSMMTFVSAIEVVLHRHESRKLFVELQDLRKAKQDLDREWGQLLLEQATWGTHGRVESAAVEQLGMLTPKAKYVVKLK